MPTLRRFLLLCALMVWQGGLIVYGAIVVPIARAEFHDLLERQAFVTSRVTHWLNVAGVVALVLWLWDIVGVRDLQPRRKRVRLILWAVILLTLVKLAFLHRALDGMMSQPLAERDPQFFRFLHRSYLWVTMVQWAMAMVLLVVSLTTWQGEDARRIPIAGAG
jgi:hypothetical protein